MIVSTDKLQKQDSDLVRDDSDRWFVCWGMLRKYFNTPPNPGRKVFWMEFSDKPQRGEWVKGEVKIDTAGFVVWRPVNEEWGGIYSAVEEFLRKHFRLTSRPKRLWCRLVYE